MQFEGVKSSIMGVLFVYIIIIFCIMFFYFFRFIRK